MADQPSAQFTVAQATTKECCGPEGCGRLVTSPAEYTAGNKTRLCVASECMAWRWSRANVPTPNEELLGWCGIAGKPYDALN